jgi:hypothetical protein
MDVTSEDSGGSSGACMGGCAGYVGPGDPVAPLIGDYAEASNEVLAFVPRDTDPDVVLLVAPGVAAVRVGHLGTVVARRAVGLPPGDKVVAFSVPQSPTAGRRSRGQPVTLVALGAGGRVLSMPAAATLPWLAPARDWTTRGGACAVSTTQPGLSELGSYVLTGITAQPASPSGSLASCIEAKYALGRSRINVAVLLDARRPGAPPAPLWNSTAVAGRPGVVEVAPPPALSQNQDTSAPLYARRDGDAWLVVQARPGFAPDVSATRLIRALESFRISRLTLPRT